MDRIITISRQYGSGGRLVAEMVSKKLGIPFYDKEVIDLAAEKSGFHVDFIRENEQKMSSSFLYSLAVGQHYSGGMGAKGIMPGPRGLPLTDQLYMVEREIIESLAKDGPCVIVGRCADYILKNSYPIFNIFICGEYETRIERIKEVYKLDRETTVSKIKKYDKSRANHYFHFTDRVWGKAENYDMVLNTSVFGIEKTAEIISRLYKTI